MAVQPGDFKTNKKKAVKEQREGNTPLLTCSAGGWDTTLASLEVGDVFI